MNRFGWNVLLGIALLAATASTAAACLWDYDTLAVERSRFPDAMELITGNFPRHSEAFYEWRVSDREKKIEAATANAASVPVADLAKLHDDLAVAYEKLGQQAKAIETIEKVEAFAPGRYETYANLGTFHIHAGDMETGKEYIEKAIEINPDAHFGREVYQKLLVEYVLESRGENDAISLPMTPKLEQWKKSGFAKFVVDRYEGEPENHDAEIARATKGVLGMLRFGNHESPVLLEALATLLVAPSNPKADAKRLASRAMLMAANHTEGETSEKYRSMAKSALAMQTRAPGTTKELKLTDVVQSLKKEIVQAKQLEKNIEADERRWIRSSADPEQEFREKYLGTASSAKSKRAGGIVGGSTAVLGFVGVIAVFAVAFALIRWWRNGIRPLTKLDATGT